VKMNNLSKWQRELVSFKGIKSTFIIEGNINDLYFIPDNSELIFDKLDETLNHIFNSNGDEYELVFCDPLFGFSDPLNHGRVSEIVERFRETAKKQREETQSFACGSSGDNLSEIIRAAITKRDTSESKPIAVVVNFASRFISCPDNLSGGEVKMFLNLLYASKNAKRVGANIKTLLLVVDKFNDIPAWFYLNNPNVRTISIPNPDRTVREWFIDNYFSIIDKNKFINMTEGMKLLEIDELRRLHQKSGMSEISDIVSVYKFGSKENKWDAIKIAANFSGEMEERVKGQKEAIEKIARIIKRSVVGFSGMQHSGGENKPRGILFLAGPTGTGKTEIVKTVAKILFGDEKALVRFDMSEYNAEHADQKLFGAPPGYIGYDQGGQLTNAVKSNPFSVLLFDEIEKAHSTIMDKFLQILEDGRMTDGQGNTVHFSETLIFFTSNAGISEEIYDEHGHITGRKPLVPPGTAYDDIQRAVESALKVKFKPEVLNRIGKNIIVFNYITEGATAEILEKQLREIIQIIARKNKISVTVEELAKKYLLQKCLEDEARENGGRGIGNVVESEFLNPLAEFIFDSKVENAVTVSFAHGTIIFGGN